MLKNVHDKCRTFYSAIFKFWHFPNWPVRVYLQVTLLKWKTVDAEIDHLKLMGPNQLESSLSNFQLDVNIKNDEVYWIICSEIDAVQEKFVTTAKLHIQPVSDIGFLPIWGRMNRRLKPK